MSSVPKPVVIIEILGGLVSGETVLNGDADIHVFDWDSIQDWDNIANSDYTEAKLDEAMELPPGEDRDRIIEAIREELDGYAAQVEADEERQRVMREESIAAAKKLLEEEGQL